MTRASDNQKTILRKYLLHDLGEAEQEAVEVRLLTDKTFSGLMAIVQDDLIDDFVAAKLSADEIESFHKNFLTTPERLQKLNFATALNRYVSDQEIDVDPSPIERFMTFIRLRPLKSAISIAGLFLILVASMFVVWRSGWLRQGGKPNFQEEFVKVNRTQETDSTLLSELKRNSRTTLVLMLRQNLVREDADSRQVKLASDVTLIRLLLEIPTGAYESYEARLQTPEGQDLAFAEGLKARKDDSGQFVVVYIPAQSLAPGDYQLRLLGNTGNRRVDLGLYPFELTTR